MGADPREQYRYYEEYGVYAYPEKQPIWYLPVLLDLWDVSFNTKEAQIVFVRYADSEQNSFWGPGTDPLPDGTSRNTPTTISTSTRATP